MVVEDIGLGYSVRYLDCKCMFSAVIVRRLLIKAGSVPLSIVWSICDKCLKEVCIIYCSYHLHICKLQLHTHIKNVHLKHVVFFCFYYYF